jgi:nicotinamide riboside transporter PnuC
LRILFAASSEWILTFHNSVATTFLAITVVWFLVDVMHLVLWTRNKFYLRSCMILMSVATMFYGALLIVRAVAAARHEQSAEGVGVIIVLLYGLISLQWKAMSGDCYANMMCTACHTSSLLSTPCVVTCVNERPI